MVADFLIGGCLDLIDNWGCMSPGELLKNIAMCGLDIGSFVPGLQGLKGLKAAKMAAKGAKLGKGANKGAKLGRKGNKLKPKQEPEVKPKQNKNSGGCGGGVCSGISGGDEYNLKNAQRKAGEEKAGQSAVSKKKMDELSNEYTKANNKQKDLENLLNNDSSPYQDPKGGWNF